MSEHRQYRRELSRQRGRTVRQTTPMGKLYLLMQAMGLRRVFTRLMRKPCHVADIYHSGRYWDSRYLLPTGDQQNLRQMQKATRDLVVRTSQAEMHRRSDHLHQFLNRK